MKYPRIRDLREDHDLTQRQMAEILNMPQPQYWRYEQGYRDIPTDLLIQIADYYRVSTDYLLERTDMGGWEEAQPQPRTPKL